MFILSDRHLQLPSSSLRLQTIRQSCAKIHLFLRIFKVKLDTTYVKLIEGNVAKVRYFADRWSGEATDSICSKGYKLLAYHKFFFIIFIFFNKNEFFLIMEIVL